MALCEKILPKPPEPAYRLTLSEREARLLRGLLAEAADWSGSPLGECAQKLWRGLAGCLPPPASERPILRRPSGDPTDLRYIPDWPQGW